MRTREELIKEWEEAPNGVHQERIGVRNILEVALDIRDLLQNPPVEITGAPIDPTNLT